VIEYSCEGDFVIASWRGYEGAVFHELWTQQYTSEEIEIACDEARDELLWQIASSRPEYDGHGERK